MKSLVNKSFALFALILLGACGAAEDPGPTYQPETVELRSYDLDKSDSAAWQLRVGKFHVQLDPRLRATHTRGRIYYRLRGSTSSDIVAVRAAQRDGLIRSSSLQSPRRFEIALGDEGMEHVLSGQPLFVELTQPSGHVITARIEIAARFVAQRGFAQLFLHAAIVPVRVGEQLVMRGRFQLPDGHSLYQAFTDDDAEIVVSQTGAQGTLDMTVFAVMLAADRPEDPVFLDSWDGAESYARSTATVLVEVETFGLTDGDPMEVWPDEPCAPQTADCLLERERGDLDTERCGLAPQVDACLGSVVAPAASDPVRFAADLRRELWRLYASDDPLVALPDAVEVNVAVDRVDAAHVQYVGPDVEGLERFDPAHVDVWRHRDPVTSGRSGHWYGAYDFEGNLLEIWRR